MESDDNVTQLAAEARAVLAEDWRRPGSAVHLAGRVGELEAMLGQLLAALGEPPDGSRS